MKQSNSSLLLDFYNAEAKRFVPELSQDEVASCVFRHRHAKQGGCGDKEAIAVAIGGITDWKIRNEAWKELNK